MKSDQQHALEHASAQLLMPAAEADKLFGLGKAEGSEEEIAEWVEEAEFDLGEAFEVVWAGAAEADLDTLDRVATNWGEPPDEDALLQMALTWGALVGDRVVEAVGGIWVYREDSLHHSVRFPSKTVEFFPMHAVLARFLLGEDAGLEASYHLLVEYLTSS